VHRGYWTKRPEVVTATNNLIEAIVDGRMRYEDLSEDDKRNLFMTELNCTQRAGVKDLLTAAFAVGAP
jgi:hypothetical protein